eukprot:TRINITY_DN9870_c0_g1_i1.p1 TRINITY_DN9870_c0_g1~~TRINITY_DN9870_c0_g1_i1.p1  ORF type:complete len:451 (+),score=45.97 TRINITY_DN9870_c0_g1_i1:501-1853(+)
MSSKSLTRVASQTRLGGGVAAKGCKDDRRTEYSPPSPFFPLFLVAVCSIIYLLRNSPAVPFLLWFLPEKPDAISWAELAAVVLLLAGVAIVVRAAVPSLRLSLTRKKNASEKGSGKQLLLPTSAAPHSGKKLHQAKILASSTAVSPDVDLAKPLLANTALSSSPTASEMSRALAKATGCGVHSYSNGDRYEGDFYQGRCAGNGVYYFAMSGRYEGEWIDGKYDGYGVETWSRGSRYRGQYREGLRDGHGVYRFYTGDVYAGDWSKGQSHGVGMQTCADGSRYIGDFQWGVKHGFGRYHFRNGDTYAGEYFNDKMHGYGVYSFANGHRYEGAWHEGRKQGLGLYTFRNGETRAGYWNRGALETRSTQAADPQAPHTVHHSKVLHAVQEARRAQSKADALSSINQDRVSGAVSAANKAALAARVAAVKATQRATISSLSSLSFSPLAQAAGY